MLSNLLFLFTAAVIVLAVSGQNGTLECETTYSFELRRLTAKMNNLGDEMDTKVSSLESDVADIMTQLSVLQNSTLKALQELKASVQTGISEAFSEVESVCNSSGLTIEQNVAATDLPSSCSGVAELGRSGRSDYYCLQNPSNGEVDAVFCTSPTNPAVSCHSLMLSSPLAPPGLYWVSASNGSAVRVFCAMRKYCCNTIGGWVWLAHFDLSEPEHSCPNGFTYVSNPRSCKRAATPGCTSINFPAHGVQYSKVCGKIGAYQYGYPDAFHPYYLTSASIDGVYVDGISITHGSAPRKHIWTFAAATDELRSNERVCPCTKTDTPYTGRVPPFIGTDYFCDTAKRDSNSYAGYYYGDPLWDGAWCGPTSSCCQFNSPPWFCKELPQPTSDDIEVRVCTNEAYSNENIVFHSIELYVQ